MGVIAQWGTVSINEEELTGFELGYALRLAKLKTVYENPIIQYVGKDVRRLSLTFTTYNASKILTLWSERQSLSATIRAVSLGGVSYGNFYLSSTIIDWTNIAYLQNDNLLSRVGNSDLVSANISLEGVQ